MTYYHRVAGVLESADKPLTCKEIHERVGGHRNKVYQVLKSMRENDDVIADKSHSDKGVFIYQSRRRLV